MTPTEPPDQFAAKLERGAEQNEAEQLHASMKALAKELAEALDTIVESEWMVTHDWGGNREAVMAKSDAALDHARKAGLV